jgi:hypothetical protein
MRRSTTYTLATLLASAGFLAGALVPCAGAQLTAQLDVGSAVRRELPAERAAHPARFDAAVTYTGPLGTLLATGQAFSGFTRSTRSDVAIDARFNTPAWSRYALRGLIAGGSAGTRLAEGVRRDRAEVAGGGAFRLLGIDVETTVGRAWFENGAVTPEAQITELRIAREFTRGMMSVGARRVEYPDAFVALRDTTYLIAGFRYHSSVERLESAERKYGEADGILEWEVRAARIEARGGVRFTAAGVRPERWARALIELPIVRRVAFVAEVGQRMSTPEQRLPAYRFGSISLRVRSQTEARALPPPEIIVSRDPSDEPRVEVSVAGTIEVRGVTATTVELMGDFTDWTPATLDATTHTTWRYHTPLRAGVYHLLMRVDGGEWQLPPGLPSFVDDLEQPVGLLVIGR